MLFFRFFSLFAALAFATLSSAIPIEGAGLVPVGDVFARDVTELALPVKRGGSVSEYYKTCHDNIAEIIVNIQIAVDAGDHDVILGYLEEIVVQINILIEAIPGAIVVDIDINVFASIVCGLIQSITAILVIVINISVDIRTCVGTIGGLLATLLHVTIGVVVNLEVVLVVLLQPLGGILNVLGFLDLFVGIGIVISL